MKIEDQVTSLELSKRLKELGVKQESLFSWVCFDGMTWVLAYIAESNSQYCAFTVAELGEMLPDIIQSKPNKSVGTGNLYLTIEHLGAYWEVGYTLASNDMIFESVESKTEANARAKMLIYLLENKLIDPTKLIGEENQSK